MSPKSSLPQDAKPVSLALTPNTMSPPRHVDGTVRGTIEQDTCPLFHNSGTTGDHVQVSTNLAQIQMAMGFTTSCPSCRTWWTVLGFEHQGYQFGTVRRRQEA
jgi:hypothetical protein